MENLITLFMELITKMMTEVIQSLYHNWLALSFAILTVAIMSVYIDQEKLKQALLRKPKVSVLSSVVVGAFTPLCACGTMAVVIGMLTTTLPWGPIMAFLTSSPLMSPDGFILNAGIIGIDFAIALTIASIVIGLGSGYLTHIIEITTDFLKNQTRFTEKPQVQACGCGDPVPASVQTCGCGEPAPVRSQACCGAQVCCTVPAVDDISRSVPVSAYGLLQVKNIGITIIVFFKRIKWREMGDAVINIGIKQILLYFSIFIAVGYLINYFVPSSYIVSLFSADSVFAVPLAALIGLPLYVSGDSAIPLIKSLMEGGAGGGAMLAFMITGPATSAWVIAGISTFMKKRAVGLYIFFILAGGILSGYIYDLFVFMSK